MKNYRAAALLLVAGCIIIAALIGTSLLSGSSQEWRVTDEGLLEYSQARPEHHISQIEPSNQDSSLQDNSTLYEVTFESRGTEISGLILMPPDSQNSQTNSIPGIVLLPGATVTKEAEQGLAKLLSSMGYASITIDQRNLGGIDIQGDLRAFLDGKEPVEHKMVHDALAAAEVLRSAAASLPGNLPEVDPDKIVYLGESNGGRFAIAACALDQKSKGVIAISTCGYGTEEAIASGSLTDPEMIRFYRSIDPDTYLAKISPRKLVMMHSQNDTIIPYEYAGRTYSKAYKPKGLYTVKCPKHGHCSDMDDYLQKELEDMLS